MKVVHRSTPAGKRFVRYALQIGAIELTERELHGHRIAPYFFNAGLFNDGLTLAELARAYAWTIVETEPEVIFGPAYKGVPICVAIALALGTEHSTRVEWAFNRKEMKDHGEGGVIVGANMRGKKVLIADDAMTTGKSSAEAVEIVLANGGIPIGCAIAFDRQERANTGSRSATQEFEANYGVPVYAVATLDDLISHLAAVTDSSDINNNAPGGYEKLQKILAYREQYGAP